MPKEIIKKMDLDKAREDKKSYTIEFLMDLRMTMLHCFCVMESRKGFRNIWMMEHLYANPEIRHLMIQES